MSFDSKGVVLTASDQDLCVCPAGQQGSIHNIFVSNTGGTTATFTLKVYKVALGAAVSVIATRSLAANTDYPVPFKVNLQPGDKLIAVASVASQLTVFYSVFLDTGTTIVSAFNGRGAYSSEATYAAGDLVTDASVTYLARTASINKTPAANATEWMPLVFVKATAADIFVGTDAAKVVTAKSLYDAAAPVALTDASTIVLDLASGINFTLTIGGNRTLGAPTGAKVGMTGTIVITQDGTGSRTLAMNSAYKFPGGWSGLSSSASKIDLISYLVKAGPVTPILLCSLAKDYS